MFSQFKQLMIIPKNKFESEVNKAAQKFECTVHGLQVLLYGKYGTEVKREINRLVLQLESWVRKK